MIFDKLFGRRRMGVPRRIYAAIVAQARQPGLYATLGVPDTVEGRFEMVALHSVLVLRRIRCEEGPTSPLGEDICAVLFSDMDHNLRELGVGDTKVGKKVRKLAEAFYGRGKAYDEAFEAEDPTSAVAEVLVRNVFVDDPVSEEQSTALAGYVVAADEAMKALSLDDVVAARLVFPPVEVAWQQVPAGDRREHVNNEGAEHG